MAFIPQLKFPSEIGSDDDVKPLPTNPKIPTPTFWRADKSNAFVLNNKYDYDLPLVANAIIGLDNAGYGVDSADVKSVFGNNKIPQDYISSFYDRDSINATDGHDVAYHKMLAGKNKNIKNLRLPKIINRTDDETPESFIKAVQQAQQDFGISPVIVIEDFLYDSKGEPFEGGRYEHHPAADTVRISSNNLTNPSVVRHEFSHAKDIN